MRRIVIEAVDAKDQRSCVRNSGGEGDWFYDDAGDLVIRVTGESLKECPTFLYAFHELAEAMLCFAAGVPQQAVDHFDDNEYFAENDIEPGDQLACPYRAQHRQAMILEHLMANFLGITHYGSIT